MVGRYSLRNKDLPGREYQSSDVLPPPPPYREGGSSPLLLTGTTTTTTTTEVVTTTTHRTTQIFSFPHWKKRDVPASVSTHKSTFHVNANGNDMILPKINSGPFLIEKELPPTPLDESPLESTGNVFGGRDIYHQFDNHLPPTSPPMTSEVPISSTLVLARASTGLGPLHTIPYASASSSSSEVNTVAFSQSASSQQSLRLSAPGVRRATSSQKLEANASSEQLSSGGGARRRTRGISLGTSSFLNFGSPDATKKSKEKETDDRHSVNASHKILSRRASFWTRKQHKKPSSAPISPVSRNDSAELPFPVLPSVQLDPPLSLDFCLTSALSSSPPHQDLNSQHSRRRSRSYSEFAGSSYPARSISDEVVPDMPHHVFTTSASASPQPHRRPATASTPTRSQARSMFIDISRPWMPCPTSTPQIQEISHKTQSSDSFVPDRSRSQTNPPTLHRSSLNLFPSPSSLSSHSVTMPDRPPVEIPSTSLDLSPHKHSTHTPKSQAHNNESPERYLTRLLSAASKAEVAATLASSADPFYVRALRLYIEQFNFSNDSLDVALRKLLMEVGLPRETQQIDRVIDAFAARYLQCNPGLFVSNDHPYVLAFSLIMLHTDAFNRSNKRKMTKSDYIKNTRLPGVAPEILDYLYDNIVFAPFIFIEDPLDINGQRGLTAAVNFNKMLGSVNNPMSNANGTALLGKGNKVDPYLLITRDLLGPLRIDTNYYIPEENPYSYEGTAGPWDEEQLQRAFAKADVIEIGSLDHTRVSPIFTLNVGVAHSPRAEALVEIMSPSGEIWTLKVTKVGLLNRKDDILEGGKRSMNRKWKFWSVILTGSQLLLFRDPSWASALIEHSNDGQIIFPQASVFKPDELLSVKDAIAVFDRSYTKHENTFRFVVPDGRQFLLQAPNELQLNEWISRINYASAFKSAGVRVRPLGISGRDAQLTGVAAATSHLHDMQHQNKSTAQNVDDWDGNAPHDLMSMLSGDFSSISKKPPINRKVKLLSGRDDMDLEVPAAPEIDGVDQFKATFDEVKAELAAGHWTSLDDDYPVSTRFSSVNLNQSVIESPMSMSSQHEFHYLSPRSQVILSKVQDLESNITAAQSQLDSDIRFVRNIAILTPFRRSTRDRLQVAVHGVAKRVMQVRLEVAKLSCHREVLLKDMEAEKRHLHQARKTAFRAATETLQSRRDIPRMTLSFYNDEMGASSSSPRRIPQELDTPSPSFHRPESSICESFHSALDFGPDWPPLPDDMIPSSLLNASQLSDSPRRSSSSSLGPCPFLDEEANPRQENPNTSFHDLIGVDSPRNSDEFPSELPLHEKFNTAHQGPEEAEEWNKTRCAKRVSLVRVPSDIQLSALFERCGAHGTARADPPS